MNYRKVTIGNIGFLQDSIIVDNANGSFKSFPAIEENPAYLDFMEHIDEYTLAE